MTGNRGARGARGTRGNRGNRGSGSNGSNRAGRASRAKPKKRRLRLFLGIGVSLVVLAAAGAGWVYFKLNGNINTFAADGIARERPKSGAAGQNVLIIGSDARTGGNDKFGGGDKDDVGRSDTAFLLHIYGDGKHAVGVSIPRDSLVDIPPCKLPNGEWTHEQSNTMFNAAFSVGQSAKGNPACTQNTVEKMTGMRVDHTVVVDFAGFSAMTSAVGGVKVCLPKDVYEGDLNPNKHARGERIFPKGVQNVSGQKALDYVRIRHGIGDGSDIGRIQRQQAFVSSLIKKIKDQGLNPTTLLPLADAATKSLIVDPGLGSADKLLSFAMSLKNIDLHNINFITVPWRYQGARVAIVQPNADNLWATLRADRTLDGEYAGGKQDDPKKGDKGGKDGGSPSKEHVSGDGVAVAVYNGTTVPGLGARAAGELKDHNFTVTRTDTAKSQTHTGTVVQYGPGAEDHAKTVADMFPGARLQQVTAQGVAVVVGKTYAATPETPKGGGDTTPDAPTKVKEKSRSADQDPCADLSYG
ncbi:LCP family protein [Streptomyces varsoviensis]|uniref:LCP family protein n=1 Tax=Streptomyces varsoviensis TaxID=67373 RepID=UPI000997E48C|nr:LCP family protein [Streptomyces varsoviensis]